MYSINKYIIILFIIIIIFNIIYYLYCTKKKKNIENFQEFMIESLGDKKVDTRPCKVYFTDNINDCDLLKDFYNKGITQLNILIIKYKNDIDTVSKLTQIKNDKIKGKKSCSVEINGWKEIKSNVGETNTYSFKNTLNDINVINGNSLTGSCFIKVDNISENLNIKNDGILSEYKNNVNFINDNNYYKGIDINLKDINLNSFNKSLCDNSVLKYKDIDIYDEALFIRFKCYIEDDILKVEYFEFVKYNKLINVFNILTDYTYSKLINDTINKLFRYFYDITTKNIKYGPKKIDTNCYIFEIDSCEKINNFNTIVCTFSFIDFDIKNQTINSYNNLFTPTNTIDDDKIDYEKDILNNLTTLTNSNSDTSAINSQIITNNTNINNLKSQIASKTTNCNNLLTENTNLSSTKTRLLNKKNSLNCSQYPRQIVNQAEKKRLAAAAAERERQRLAAEAAERERQRLAAEAAERERQRLAAEAAEKERQRLAAEAAEKERQRLAAEAAEKERQRLAAEAAERERQRLAAEAAEKERQRLAAEAADNVYNYKKWNRDNNRFRNTMGECCNNKLYGLPIYSPIERKYCNGLFTMDGCKGRAYNILQGNPYKNAYGVNNDSGAHINNIENFANKQVNENFANGDPMMINPARTTCDNTFSSLTIQINNKETEINNKNTNYNTCIDDKNRMNTLKTNLELDNIKLNKKKDEMTNLFTRTTNIKKNMNLSYKINQLNNMIKGKSVNNITNYIDNVSNDDFIYININI